MKTIWKFSLPIEDLFSVDLPSGAKVIHVAEQSTWPGQLVASCAHDGIVPWAGPDRL